MAKKKAKAKAKKKKVGKKKGKRKLPLALKLSRECAKSVGVVPFKKWTKKNHADVKACIAKKTRKSKKA